MTALWERGGHGGKESAVAYEAFGVFRDQPPSERTIKGTGERLGKSRALMTQWARQHQWNERVEAWDARQDSRLIEVREASLDQYSEALNRHLQLSLVAVNQITNEALREIRERQKAGGIIDLLLLNRLLSAIEKADALGRRSAGMPTAYVRDKGTEQPADENIYLVGASRGDENEED